MPEELLHPKDKKKTPTEPSLPEFPKFEEEPAAASTTTTDDDAVKTELELEGGDKSTRLAEKFKIDEKMVKKLLDLEKTLKDRKTMPPPSIIPGQSGSVTTRAGTRSTIDSSSLDSRARSGSFTLEDDNTGNQTLPGNFQRNTRMTKSARPYGKSTSGSNLRTAGSLKRQTSSSKNSPLLERKSNAEATPS